MSPVDRTSPSEGWAGLIDCHTHVASLDFIPRAFIEGVADNLHQSLVARGAPIPRSKILDRCLDSVQDDDCSELLAEMEAAGISKSVLLIADMTYCVPDCPLTIEEIFHRHAELLRGHRESFEVFGGVDPRWGKDGLDLFERSVSEWGFAGLKLYPPCGYSPSDRRLFPFYEICRERGLPVLLHIGPTSPLLTFEFSSPLWVDEAARSFPGVDFILAHGAVHHVEESIMLCEYRPNVYMDLSGLQAKLECNHQTGHYRHLFRRGLNHKILFGTDWPLFRLQGSQRDFIDDLSSDDQGLLVDLPERQRHLVLRENSSRLLEPETEPAGTGVGV